MHKLSLLFLFCITISYNTFSQTKVKIFPNPATNVVNILGLKNAKTSTITIQNSYGNIMLKHTWEIKNNALNIPLSSLTKGVYIITIRSKEEQLQTKFYKQ